MRFIKLTMKREDVLEQLEAAGFGVDKMDVVASRLGINKSRLSYICSHFKFRSGMIEHWTANELSSLEKMVERGETFVFISKSLGRTPTACRMKYRRYFLGEGI